MKLPGTIKCIGSNMKMDCKIKQNNIRQNETINKVEQQFIRCLLFLETPSVLK